jgi:hypothetical protein
VAKTRIWGSTEIEFMKLKLGKGFADAIFLGRSRSAGKVPPNQIFDDKIDNVGYPSRFLQVEKINIYPLFVILGLGFLVLIGKLFFLQILTGNFNRTLANENRIKLIKKRAPRGVIFDRNSKALVRNWHLRLRAKEIWLKRKRRGNIFILKRWPMFWDM